METAIVILSMGVALFAVCAGLALVFNSGCGSAEDEEDDLDTIAYEVVEGIDGLEQAYKGLSQDPAAWAGRVKWVATTHPKADSFRENMVQAAGMAILAVREYDRQKG
jgi:hypothetical protein